LPVYACDDPIVSNTIEDLSPIWILCQTSYP
jgi:hypothetical protein